MRRFSPSTMMDWDRRGDCRNALTSSSIESGAAGSGGGAGIMTGLMTGLEGVWPRRLSVLGLLSLFHGASPVAVPGREPDSDQRLDRLDDC